MWVYYTSLFKAPILTSALLLLGIIVDVKNIPMDKNIKKKKEMKEYYYHNVIKFSVEYSQLCYFETLRF